MDIKRTDLTYRFLTRAIISHGCFSDDDISDMNSCLYFSWIARFAILEFVFGFALGFAIVLPALLVVALCVTWLIQLGPMEASQIAGQFVSLGHVQSGHGMTTLGELAFICGTVWLGLITLVLLGWQLRKVVKSILFWIAFTIVHTTRWTLVLPTLFIIGLFIERKPAHPSVVVQHLDEKRKRMCSQIRIID